MMQTTPDERTWGMIAHLSALLGVIVPFGNVIAPLIVWLARRERSAFVANQAKEALNFNITTTIAGAVCYALIWALVGIPLFIALFIFWLAMTFLAAVRANEGIAYRHPFTLRLVA
jgi:uncharacterized Tic20 family protein